MIDSKVAISDEESFEFEALRQAHNYRQALLDEFSSVLKGNILEVGAGIGQMTELLRHHPGISRLVCVEPNPSFCEKHRRGLPGVELVPGTVANLTGQEGWNAIISINVLEHISGDAEELKIYADLLRPEGGRLCLIVPARPEIYGPIDARFGHFRRYTRQELGEKLRSAGFAVEKLVYFNLVGYFAWWVNFRLLKGRTFNLKQVRFFDSLIFPVSHRIETRLFRPPLGQSLVAVAAAR